MDSRSQAVTRRTGKWAEAVGLLVLWTALRPAPCEAGRIYEFPLGVTPAGIASGPDGNLWFTEKVTNKIGRITTAGVVTEFPVPTPGAFPGGITAGSDGNLWFTEPVANQIGRITPLGVVTEFPVLTADSAPMGITAGPDGNVWFTQGTVGKIGKITPAGVVTEYPLPDAASYPLSIATGSDGNLWFVEFDTGLIGRMTTAGVLDEFAPPLGASAIAAGPDGNLWYTSEASNSIGTITTAGVITEFPLPFPSSDPQGIVAGPDRRLWFTEAGGNKIGRIATWGDITEYALPSPGVAPSWIAAGADGNLWFTQDGSIGRYTTAPAKGDLNDDGRSDLVFRNLNDPTKNRVWFMNGVARASQDDIVPDAPSADWLIRGSDDFGSDPMPARPGPGLDAPGGGRDFMSDLVLWNQVTGEVAFWMMFGRHRVAAFPLTGASPLPTNWDLAATGEFNHDGKPDIVWRDLVSQAIVIWTMDGTEKAGEIVPNPPQAVDGNWTIVAAADYNNDVHTDFLWYNFTSGKIVTWYMDANVVRTAGQFTNPANAGDANWRVLASSDYSGATGLGTPPLDSPDIVWRNETSGNQVVWHMDFASTRVFGEFTNPLANANPLGWTIAGPR